MTHPSCTLLELTDLYTCAHALTGGDLVFRKGLQISVFRKELRKMILERNTRKIKIFRESFQFSVFNSQSTDFDFRKQFP